MWNLKRIEQYITDSVEENIHLDYKGSGSLSNVPKKKTEISKDVSAFANSDGGVIIYGVSEYDDKKLRHLPEKIDSIDGNEFSKEWLEQVINSTISPTIPNIIITPIHINSPESNEVVYVVEIPKSTTAHQMKDKRYYRRYNFESIPMEDWEIKDIINRSNTSDIVIHFEKLDKTPFDMIKEWILKKDNISIRYNVVAHNKGNKVAQMLNAFISGDELTAAYVEGASLESDGLYELNFSNEIERKINLDGRDYVINTQRIPIMPHTYHKIGKITIKSNLIQEGKFLTIQISTEDYSKTSKFETINFMKQ